METLMLALPMITKVMDLNLKSINSIMQVDTGMDLISSGQNCIKLILHGIISKQGII